MGELYTKEMNLFMVRIVSHNTNNYPPKQKGSE